MRLILIRHGEAAFAEQRVPVSPRTSRVLTEQGYHQVRKLAERFRTTGELRDCQVLLSSPLTRAWQMAEVLAQVLPVSAIKPDPDLREMVAIVPREVSHETSSDHLGVQEAESWEEFTRRVQTTLERLSAQYAGQTVVAVTHAGVIVASVIVVFAIPRPGTGARLDPDSTSLTEWQVREGRWRLVRYHDTAHLSVGSLHDE